MKRENNYVKASLAVFFTVAAILLFYDTMFGSRAAVIFGKKLLGALKPILFGALMAYLLAPTIDFWELKLFRESVRRAKAEGKLCAPGPRAVSLLVTWIIICVLVYLLLSVLLPELYNSLFQLLNNLESYYNTINNWVMDMLDENPAMEGWVVEIIQGYYNDLLAILTEKVMPQTILLMSFVSGGVVSALVFVKDLVVGIIVSIYLLTTKERCAAHSRKVLYSVGTAKNIPWLFRGVHRVDDIFSGFVRGKLLDSLIIGIICFVGCRILSIPYTPLVSVIIGVTNVIPFFGPFLGAIPCLFLILLVSPIRALYFLIFILALQQVDGNIIGPKILGDKTGLSSLWVITAILVGGAFFGVPGMFFGVPVFACLYSCVSFLVRVRLKGKGLPVDTMAYQTDIPDRHTPPVSEKKP